MTSAAADGELERTEHLYRYDLYNAADVDAGVIIERERLRSRLHNLLADLARSA